MPESTGTITVTNGSTAVTGSGTLFADNFVGANDVLIVDGLMYIVDSVTSNTALTLTRPYTGTTASGKTYDIVHLTGEEALNELARQVAALVNKYGITVNSITDTPGASKIPKADANGKLARNWLPLFTAASSSAAGQAGAVPAPEQTDQPLFLLSDGTWRRGVPVTFTGGTGLNLDAYVEAGQYAFLAGAVSSGSNFPSAASGVLEVYGNNVGQLYQRYTDTSCNIYIRLGADTGVFTDWRKISYVAAPQTAEGPGQWVMLVSEPGEALSLPSGGTWAVFAFAYNSSGTSDNSSLVGVKAGGASIVSSTSPYTVRGFAWRIV